jgi:hypothetical protein
MKKLILSLLFVSAFAFIGFSQDDGSFKPTSGFTAEVNFIPANTSMPISMDYLKLRMFMSENLAFRLSFNFNMHKENFKNSPEGPSNLARETQNKYTVFGIIPGIEMHLGDLPKLSPYVGAEIGFFMKSSKSKIDNYYNDVTNLYYTLESEGAWWDGNTTSEIGYTQIDFNLLLGTDYYFSKHFYTGVEIGFGLTNTTSKEVKYSISGSETHTSPKQKAFDIGFKFQPSFRLGWAF